MELTGNRAPYNGPVEHSEVLCVTLFHRKKTSCSCGPLRAVSLLLLFVFFLAGAATNAPAFCCLAETEQVQVETACCCPEQVQPKEKPAPAPCGEEENCPKSCCSLAATDQGFPLPARLMAETPAPAIEPVAVIAFVPLPAAPMAQPASPPLISKTPLHLRLQVLLC